MNPEYNIDLTEDEYTSFDGDTIEELKDFIYPDRFMDCCGYLNNNGKTLWVAAVKEYGVYLGYCDSGNERLSLSDRNNLDKVVDVWGDGLYVSEGLFISPETAWQCIYEFATTGNIQQNIEWISPDELFDITEDGNYII